MTSVVDCTYTGNTLTHTINFSFKSCTCRWFMAFTVCSHLLAACDLFDQRLEGYTKVKTFVYRKRRGRAPKPLTFTQLAFSANPMPIIPTPTPILHIADQRRSLFLIDTNNMPSHPELTCPELAVEVEALAVGVEAVAKVTKRAYTRKAKTATVEAIVEVGRKSKRLQREVVPAKSTDPIPKKRGRPKKIGPALSLE